MAKHRAGAAIQRGLMTSTATVKLDDERYFQVAPSNSFTERLLIRARARIYEDFVACCHPTPDSTILDVGVTDIITDGANPIERHHPHPRQITGAGLASGEGIAEAYGLARYVQIEANARLPFEDNAFDIVTSNAVIEHVGSRAMQHAFVKELARVGRQVFISAPNRYFPVEHHTAVPLLHFWRPSFALACTALGKTEWLGDDYLILTSMKDLKATNPSARFGYTGLALGPFSSNLFMHFVA